MREGCLHRNHHKCMHIYSSHYMDIYRYSVRRDYPRQNVVRGRESNHSQHKPSNLAENDIGTVVMIYHMRTFVYTIATADISILFFMTSQICKPHGDTLLLNVLYHCIC